MAGQAMLSASDGYAELDRYLLHNGTRHVFLVCDGAIGLLRIGAYLERLHARLGIKVSRFSGFSPNPSYESVVSGVARFRESGCDMIAAVGGGSAIDVAKCIKLYSNMDGRMPYLGQAVVPNDTPLLAVPTTAGTGSEATRYAVIYHRGEKQSIDNEICIPSAVLMDPSALDTLPMYQRKATMLDALCHAIESCWSVNSTDESKKYSRQAIRLIMGNMDAYLANDTEGNANMLKAANLAGKAINISQTTAGHAMCYKLTGLYGIAHGHAAALCLGGLWPYMLGHADLCVDPRGLGHLNSAYVAIASAMGRDKPGEAVSTYKMMLKHLSLDIPVATEEDFQVLTSSVNPLRLKNHPIKLDEDAMERIYRGMLKTKKQ